jgi:adenosine deaminase
LAEEYQALVQELGFSHDDIRTLILQAIQASWQSDEKKQALIAAFRRDPVWLKQKNERTKNGNS